MTALQLYIALLGLSRKEVVRWLRIWPQSLLPPAISSSLYFLIFGEVIGERIGEFAQLPYISYIAPGLIMMLVITNCYANVSSSLFGARFGRSIEELFVSSMPNWSIVTGYIIGGSLRGIATGMIIFLISIYFADLHFAHIPLILFSLVLCSVLFSLAGFLNGMLARKFDDTSVFITFVLTPLIYLGGVFYDVNDLPGIWHTLSLFNPIYYIVSLFRHAMLGIGDQAVVYSLIIIISLIVVLFLLCWHLLNIGFKIKS